MARIDDLKSIIEVDDSGSPVDLSQYTADIKFPEVQTMQTNASWNNGVAKGFRLEQKTALVTFEGTDFDGAEVRLRLDFTVEEGLEFPTDLGANNREAIIWFGNEVLKSWNLEEDDGTPVAPTGEGMLQIPLTMANILFNQWGERFALSSPLERPSPAQDMSLEESMPMEMLSSNPQ